MALSLKNLKTVRATDPPRVLIYGPEKIGKTTLASEFPNPVFIQTESGQSGSLALTSFGLLNTFQAVLDALQALATEEHDFQTLVVDSITELEKLVFAEACARNKWKSIETPGYGKGYVEAEYVWREFIDAFNFLRTERQMMVVLIGHAVITRFDDPETQSYSRYDIDLHKRAEALIKREVDAILLIKKDVTIKVEEQGFNKSRATAKGGDSRWIYTEGKPAFAAGNRYSMPEKILYTAGQGFASLASYFPQSAAAKEAA